jgi:hypothetical protein
MASETLNRGTRRVLSKLEKSIEDGDHYEAHQMIRTLYFRWDISGRWNISRSRFLWVKLDSIYNLYFCLLSTFVYVWRVVRNTQCVTVICTIFDMIV